MRRFKLPVLAVCLTLIILFTGSNTAQAENSPEHTIRVNGEATMEIAPDQAELNFSVITEGPDAKKVQHNNTANISKVVKALKELGTAGKDIQTQNYRLNPQYTYPSKQSSLKEEKTKKIEGYEAVHRMKVKVRDLDNLGEVIDTALENGANQISNVRFTTGDALEFKKKALQKAAADAQNRAEILASTLGTQLKGIKTAHASWNSNNPRPIEYNKKMADGAGRAAESVASISPGMVKVNAYVNIEYLIN
ncbi:MAG: SIMPL domain-containing protein [Clostridiales bacterium]|nr:SIMPL domain-containing protein [Clostridiales bacterium]MCF8022870.1 SIMPL domain-containing protein [Clostridiales bacterium]